MQATLKDANTRMEKAVTALEKEFSHLRTGRASVALLDGLKVDYYGTPTAIDQLASLSTPDSRTITIQPWDRAAFGLVEKAILKSDLGLTPINDGKVIRIGLPPLTEDRRKDLVKVAKKYTEEAKVAVRNIRRDANDALKKLQKDKAISEDDLRKGEADIQKTTDAFVAKLSQDGVASDQLFVAGHSQGGLIAALWGLSRGRHVSGFVLTSPYFRMAIKPPLLKVVGAKLVGRVVPWLPVSTGIRMEELTSDPDHQRWTERDPLYGRATTPRWFDESNRAQREVMRRAAEWEHPLLVLAGGADPIADTSAMRAFVETARAQDKQFRVYEGFRHEILNEVEREKPLGDAVAWLSQRTRPPRG